MGYKPQGIRQTIEGFISDHGHHIFYIQDIQKWVKKNYTRNHTNIINRMLNNSNIIELGDSAYEYIGN